MNCRIIVDFKDGGTFEYVVNSGPITTMCIAANVLSGLPSMDRGIRQILIKEEK